VTSVPDATVTYVVESPGTGRRVARVAIWIAVLALAALVCQLLGVDLKGWLSSLWDAITGVSFGYLVLGVVFQTIQTGLTALAWVGILRAAYPGAPFTTMQVVTCYAVSVALNGVLPANIGTFTMLFMFLAVIRGSTFPGIFSGYLVQKIFFTLVGGLVYLYLFLSVSGSFDVKLGGLADHWVLAIAIAVGVVALIALLVRLFWGFAKKLWAQAKQGAAILGQPREYFLKVFLPELGGYLAKIAVIATFLAAYSIPVTFHSIMSVVGSNSIANVTSVTPGGVGVNQALNALALDSYTSSATATAYSITQQLVTTAWNILVAAGLVALVFGWQGGRKLVETSYGDARAKASEMQSERRAKREAKREARESRLPFRRSTR
jgi:uncharacterized membrane protein YbhN (UPF0104 family)